MRIVLDDMPEDPDPIRLGAQGTVVDADQTQVIVDWDEDVHRSLHLIPGVDRFHVINLDSDLELEQSFRNLRNIQTKAGRLTSGLSSRCPRCGQLFDCKRGAVSRAVTCCNISVCSTCGYQEAIERFVLHGAEMGCDVEIEVPEGANHTVFPTVSENRKSSETEPKGSSNLVSHKGGYESNLDNIDTNSVAADSGNNLRAAEGDKEQKREKLKISLLPLTDWYIVRVWTGKQVDEHSVVINERMVAE